MNSAIKLIVGLGNPGPDYQNTRHNAGAWFVEAIAKDHQASLRPDTKFKSKIAQIRVNETKILLLCPLTFMNLSGQAVKAVCQFYKIKPAELLVAHDELDMPPGVAKLKFDGGHGGHNGLRDIIAHLGSRQFHRLRLGIGHPGHSNQVSNYVLKKPAKQELEQIETAMAKAMALLPTILEGQLQQAMQALHG